MGPTKDRARGRDAPRHPSRDQAPRGPDPSRTRLAALADDASGVTPLIGAVLTMVIVVGAIGAIMVWGLPAMQHAGARASLDAVVAQLGLLDDLTDDMAEAGGGIAGKAVFTYDRGGMTLGPRGDRWVVVYGLGVRPANLSLAGLSDGDANLTVRNEAGGAGAGGGAGTGGAVSSVVASFARVEGDRIVPIGTAGVGDLTPGNQTRVQVQDATGRPVPVDGRFLRIRFHEFAAHPDTLVAEAWVVDPGAVAWRLASPGGFFEARLVQSAVLVRTPFDARIEGLDAVTWVQRNASQTPALFVSVERIRADGPGVATTAGRGSWGLRVQSDVATTLLPRAVLAEHLRISVAGPDGDLWRRWLVIEEPHLQAQGDAAYLRGPITLSLFTHEVAVPEGFTPR